MLVFAVDTDFDLKASVSYVTIATASTHNNLKNLNMF